MNETRLPLKLLLCMWSALATLPPSVAPADDFSSEKFARWVTAEGGEVAQDGAGRITDVYLGFTWATDGDLGQLRPLSGQLERLDLSLTYISDRGMEQLRSFTALKDLNLFAAEFITDAGVACLRGNTELESLSLRGTDITDVSMEYVATLSNLKSLDVSFTQLNDTGLEHLAPLSKLEKLVAGGNKISGVGLHVLKLLPRLKSLDLTGVQRRNAGYCWAASVTDMDLELIGSLSQLEELNLGRGTGLSPGPRSERGGTPVKPEVECRITGGIRITNLGLDKLRGLKHLRSLDISGSEVTADGLRRLASFPSLEYLSLWGMETVDDQAAGSLAALGALKILDLTDTLITDETLDQLASLDGLRRLYVSGTGVTSAGIKSFGLKNANCQLSWRSGIADNLAE